jgi:hypothetical protein
MDVSYREPVKSAYFEWGDPFSPQDLAVAQLHFDVVLSEEHERSAEVTSHTVEQGAAIVDHVRPNPDRLQLVCFVSNSPIVTNSGLILPMTLQLDAPGSGSLLEGGTSALLDKGLQFVGLQKGFPSSITVNVLQFDSEHDFVADAYETLTRLRDTAQILTVVTPRATYFSMVVERVQMRRDAGTGTSANFEIDLKEIRIVSSSITDAPLPTIPQAAPKKDLGNQAPKVPDGPKESTAHRAAVGLGAPSANIFGN